MQSIVTYCLLLLQKKFPGLTKDADSKELTTSSIQVLFLSVIGFIFGYIFLIIAGRLYGAESVGVFGLAHTILTIVTSIGLFGIGESVVRFLGEANGEKNSTIHKKIFSLSIFFLIPIALILGIIIFIFAAEINQHFFHDPALTYAIKITAIVIPFSILFRFFAGYLRGIKHVIQSELLKKTLLRGVATITIFGSLLFFKKTIYIPIQGYLLSTLGMFLFGSYWCFHHLKSYSTHNNQEDSQSIIDLKKILIVSAPIMITGMSYMIMSHADLLMIGYFLDTKELGIYTTASKLSLLVSFMLNVVGAMLGPKISQHFRSGKKDKLKDIVHLGSKMIFFLSVPIALFLLIFPSFMLSLFGTDFTGGSLSLIILTLGQLTSAVSGSNGLYMNMTGKQKALTIIIVFSSIINIFLNWYLIPFMGITGAAIATTAGIVVWNLNANIYVYKKDKIKTFYIPGVS